MRDSGGCRFSSMPTMALWDMEAWKKLGYSPHTTAWSIRWAEAISLLNQASPFPTPLQQNEVEVSGKL